MSLAPLKVKQCTVFSKLFSLKAGFSCGSRWSPAVSVQPAPRDTVKMQQHISDSARVYTWNRASSGHQHLIFCCCQPVSLAKGKQHHQLEQRWDIWGSEQRWWANLLVKDGGDVGKPKPLLATHTLIHPCQLNAIFISAMSFIQIHYFCFQSFRSWNKLNPLFFSMMINCCRKTQYNKYWKINCAP